MIPIDKQLHLMGGAVIAFTVGHFLDPSIGLIAAIAAGAIKEIYDGYHPESHTEDILDFVATALGGLFAYCVLIL